MSISGFLGFAADLQSPWWHISALVVGIGAGLTVESHLSRIYRKLGLRSRTQQARRVGRD